MKEWLEGTLVRWLQAVAPPGWADTVLGDLREERRRWRLLHLARIAARFQLEALSERTGGRKGPVGRNRGGVMLTTELRHALRGLRRSPGYTVVAIVTLALAIGANTAIYSALHALVLAPLPFKDSGRFVYIWHKNPQMSGILVTPPQKAVDQWRSLTHVFEAIESFTTETLIVSERGEPEEVSVSLVPPSLLSTFGVQPILGRGIVETDTAPDAPLVAVISHGMWTKRFGRDPAVSGKTMTLSGTPYIVIGVLPRRFLLPFGSDSILAAARRGHGDKHNLNTIGKLRTGVGKDQAQRALDALGTAGADEALKGWSGHLMSPADYNGTQIKVALFVLAGAVALLLLIACVNVANLVLTRNSAMRRELALRHALGASRGRTIAYLLAESSIVAAAGGIAGLLVAHWSIAAMVALRPKNLDILERISLDGAALGFVAGTCALSALLFGVAPAITATRVDLLDGLRTSSGSMTASTHRVRRLLATAQIAIALVLLVGATLLLRSYAKLTAVDPGFDPKGILSVRISLPAARYPVKEKARRHAFFEQVLESVRALPGVTTAAAGSGVPPDTGIMFGKVEIHGRPAAPRNGLFSGGYVTPSYFSTLGIPIVEGRPFTAEDRIGREPVAIVGQSLAREYWPGQSPLGARMRIQSVNEWATIVGVAADVKGVSLAKDSGRLQIYFPRAQTQPGFGAIILRAAGDPAALIPAIKSRIWAIDPALPLREIVTADQLLARATSQARFNLALLAAFACCGLVLAVVGVYGVMALFVGQRQRELGIRIALGASSAAVAGLVMRQTVAVLAGGIVAGIAGAAAATRLLQSLLFETASRDVSSFAVAASSLAIAAVIATLVPLRRATGADPRLALRDV